MLEELKVYLVTAAEQYPEPFRPSGAGPDRDGLEPAPTWAGDTIAAHGRIFELTSAVGPCRRAPYIYWWSEAEAEAHWAAGSSALFLGDLRQAETHYWDALAPIASSFPLGCDARTCPTATAITGSTLNAAGPASITLGDDSRNRSLSGWWRVVPGIALNCRCE